MQPRLHGGVVGLELWLRFCYGQQVGEEQLAARRVMPIVARAGERADQQSPSLTEAMRDRGHMPVRVAPGCFASLGFIFLNEITAEYFLTVDFQRQIFEQVGGEFDVALLGAE